MTSRSKLMLIPVAAFASALTGAAIAIAGGPGQTVHIATQVKIRNSAPTWHGRVTADNEACIAQRKVKLFRGKHNGGKELLGKTFAASSGKWQVPVDQLKGGEYYAVATKVTEGTAGTIYVCDRAISRGIFLG